MSEGIEQQITRLFGVSPQLADAAAMQMQAMPPVKLAKTMFSDMRVYSMLQNNPINLRSAFIGVKSPIDVMLEKQERLLADAMLGVEYLYPRRTRFPGGHTARNTFVLKIRPFIAEHGITHAMNAERERALLEHIEPLYRNMPGAEVSWGSESLHIGDKVREAPALIVILGKTPEASRARELLLAAMRDKNVA